MIQPRYLSLFTLLLIIGIAGCKTDKPSFLEELRIADTTSVPPDPIPEDTLRIEHVLEVSAKVDWRILGRQIVGAFCFIPEHASNSPELKAGNYFIYSGFGGSNEVISKINDNTNPETSIRFTHREGSIADEGYENPVGYAIFDNKVHFYKGSGNYVYKPDYFSWIATESEVTGIPQGSIDSQTSIHFFYNSENGLIAVNKPYGFSLVYVENFEVNWNKKYDLTGYYARAILTGDNLASQAVIVASLSDGNIPSNSNTSFLINFDDIQVNKFNEVNQISSTEVFDRLYGRKVNLIVLNQNNIWYTEDLGETHFVIDPVSEYRSYTTGYYGYETFAVDNGNVVQYQSNQWNIKGNLKIEGKNPVIQHDYYENYIVGTEDGNLYVGGELDELKRAR